MIFLLVRLNEIKGYSVRSNSTKVCSCTSLTVIYFNLKTITDCEKSTEYYLRSWSQPLQRKEKKYIKIRWTEQDGL